MREDIVALLLAQGKYREARKVGYRYAEAIKEDGKPVPAALTLNVARAELGYGKPSAALSLAREAKQSDNAEIRIRWINNRNARADRARQPRRGRYRAELRRINARCRCARDVAREYR